MEVFVYLDESGCIHKNSKSRYFVVSGYLTFKEEKNKITSLYKRLNKEIKNKRNIPLTYEIKSFDMKIDEKIKIFEQMQKIDTFYGISIIFDKENMRKKVDKANIFYNYAVKLLFKDCILSLINKEVNNKKIKFIISADNRNVSVGKLKNLEDYLKTEFCLFNFDFAVTYYNSKTNFGIQLADLIVNTFYNSYKNIEIVKDVVKVLEKDKFIVSLFPSFKIVGKTQKNK